MEEKVFREILKRQEMYFRNLELSKLQEQEEEKQKETEQENIKEKEQQSTDKSSNKEAKKK